MQQTSYKTHFPLQILIKLSFFWLTESLYIFFYSIYFMYYVFGPLPCVNLVNNQANNHSKLFQFSAPESDRRLILQVLLIIIEAFVKLW